MALWLYYWSEAKDPVVASHFLYFNTKTTSLQVTAMDIVKVFERSKFTAGLFEFGNAGTKKRGGLTGIFLIACIMASPLDKGNTTS